MLYNEEGSLRKQVMLFTYAPINFETSTKTHYYGKIADKHTENLKLAPGEI